MSFERNCRPLYRLVGVETRAATCVVRLDLKWAHSFVAVGVLREDPNAGRDHSAEGGGGGEGEAGGGGTHLLLGFIPLISFETVRLMALSGKHTLGHKNAARTSRVIPRQQFSQKKKCILLYIYTHLSYLCRSRTSSKLVFADCA